MIDSANVLQAGKKKYIIHYKDCVAGDADQPGNSSSSQFKPKAVKLSFFHELVRCLIVIVSFNTQPWFFYEDIISLP